jgi:hypothetical protein
MAALTPTIITVLFMFEPQLTKKSLTIPDMLGDTPGKRREIDPIYLCSPRILSREEAEVNQEA